MDARNNLASNTVWTPKAPTKKKKAPNAARVAKATIKKKECQRELGRESSHKKEIASKAVRASKAVTKKTSTAAQASTSVTKKERASKRYSKI